MISGVIGGLDLAARLKYSVPTACIFSDTYLSQNLVFMFFDLPASLYFAAENYKFITIFLKFGQSLGDLPVQRATNLFNFPN